MKIIFVITIFLFSLVGCGNKSNEQANAVTTSVSTKKIKNNSKKYNELVASYVGKTVPYEQFNEIGQPKTLSGTTNAQWVVYFPKADFTIVSNKKTDIVRTIYIGKREF